MLRGWRRSTVKILLAVNASSAIRTLESSASLIAFCNAAWLALVGWVINAGTSALVAMVRQPVRTITAKNRILLVIYGIKIRFICQGDLGTIASVCEIGAPGFADPG